MAQKVPTWLRKFLNGPASFWDLFSSYLAQSSYLVRNITQNQDVCFSSARPKRSVYRGAYCILRKIVLLSPMPNMCARFAYNCTYFSNAQYMCKIVLIFPMRNICARFAKFVYAHDLRKIVLISPMRNIFARFAQDCILWFLYVGLPLGINNWGDSLHCIWFERI